MTRDHANENGEVKTAERTLQLTTFLNQVATSACVKKARAGFSFTIPKMAELPPRFRGKRLLLYHSPNFVYSQKKVELRVVYNWISVQVLNNFAVRSRDVSWENPDFRLPFVFFCIFAIIKYVLVIIIYIY
eukprot:Pompholyxophrys_sp_v1_NODE_12_length_5133_cov_3.790272.p3 type:complete len:131 gc:universal NODE_12_length_5133_cov_3.790272:3390-2998(-)